MKNLFWVLSFCTIGIFSAQEYQYQGKVNGRDATLLLHFVTASDNADQIWSHGSFYFNDDEIPNVVYQYKADMPESGMLKFNLIPINIKEIDYVEGKVTKSDFTGKYVLDGKEYPIDFKTKVTHDFIIYNYYKKEQNKSGNTLKYFGKFIAPTDKHTMLQLTSYLSQNASQLMPRPFLEEYYKTQHSDFETNGHEDWLDNLAVYPIISSPDKVVYKVNYYLKKGDHTVKDYTTFINYSEKEKKVITSKEVFQEGKESEIQAVIQQNAQKSNSEVLRTNYEKIPYTDNIYFVKNGVMFFYPAILGKDSKPFGPFEVMVPFEELSGLMK